MSHIEGLRPRILVVDDDKAILTLVGTRLTLAGYDIYSARNGAEALSRLDGVRPQAMILDLNMPILDGFGVLRALGLEKAHRLPTMVLTARHEASDVHAAVKLGARDYLAKPFKDQQLLMRVARLLRPRADRLSLEQSLDAVEQQMLDG